MWRALAVTVVASLPTSAALAAKPAVVARKIPFATNLAFDPAGGMWVTSGAGGANSSDGVWYVPRGGRPRHVIRGLATALGLRWYGGTLFVSHITTPSNGRVSAFSGFAHGRFARRRVVLDHVRVGRHTMDSIVAGPGRRLYVGVGSVRDNSGLAGRILSFSPRGGHRRLEATGLRNPYGLAFHGDSLLVTDNGRDDLGETQPPDELDAFDPARAVADFGFPRCFDQGGGACAGKRRPLASFPAHASSDGLAVKRGSAYVAENGSTIRRRPSGNDVLRVDLRSGRHTRLWRSPVAHDPLGAAIGPDGDLYVTLFLSGRVVRFRL